MSHVYVTSDWHIGHTGIHEKFRTQFPSEDAHDKYILSNAKGALTKRDTLIVVGDVTWTADGLQKIMDAKLPCRMIMVAGNHDTLPVSDYLQVFEDVKGVYRYKRYWITHMPAHRLELYGKYNIHGHCHRGGPWEVNAEKEYFNAILEFNDYMPVNMQVVGNIMKERGNA